MHQPEMRWTREPEPAPADVEGRISREVLGVRPDHVACIFDHAVKDNEATQASGRPRYKDHPYIAVRAVDENNYVARPLTDEDRLRFPRALAAYEKRRAGGLTHALDLLPGIRPAQVLELEALKIESMEALAASDIPLDELEPFRAAARRILKPRFRVVEGQMVAA